MGLDSKLICYKTDQRIYCDRLYNLDNEYTTLRGLKEYLVTKGLPAYMLIDLCNELNVLFQFERGMYGEIIADLKMHDQNDIFVLIDEHHEDYHTN